MYIIYWCKQPLYWSLCLTCIISRYYIFRIAVIDTFHKAVYMLQHVVKAAETDDSLDCLVHTSKSGFSTAGVH